MTPIESLVAQTMSAALTPLRPTPADQYETTRTNLTDRNGRLHGGRLPDAVREAICADIRAGASNTHIVEKHSTGWRTVARLRRQMEIAAKEPNRG